MPLPAEWTKRGLELAKGSLIFGQSFDDLTRDELIAAAATGWHAVRQRDEAMNDVDRLLASAQNSL